MLPSSKKAGSSSAAKRFAAHEVKNLWALAQLFYFQTACSWGESDSQFRIVFDPKEDVSEPQKITPSLFEGVVRVVFQGIAWPVKSVSAAGTAEICSTSVRGKAVVTFEVDESVIHPFDDGAGVLVLEESSGRVHKLFKKGAL